jgi:hypothetical protein
MSPARLLRLAGLVSVAAGVLLVVTQLLFSLTFVVAAGDPVRRARSPLAGVNGLLTPLAVYLLLLGLVGFLVAVLGTMLLAGAWWLEAFAVPWAVLKAPALVAATPTGRLLAGRSVSFGVFALGWVLFGLAGLRARVFPRDAAILPDHRRGDQPLDRRRSGCGCAAGGGGGVDGRVAAAVGPWRPGRTAPAAAATLKAACCCRGDAATLVRGPRSRGGVAAALAPRVAAAS